jgi:hypothetical protein
MNEARVARLIRELRCDPVTRWFEVLFGLDESAAAQAKTPAPGVDQKMIAPAEESEIESWLL